jgi:hypothetical protein
LGTVAVNDSLLVQRRQNHRELPDPLEARPAYSARPAHLSVDVSMEGFPVYILQRDVRCLSLGAAHIKHLYDAGMFHS